MKLIVIIATDDAQVQLPDGCLGADAMISDDALKMAAIPKLCRQIVEPMLYQIQNAYMQKQPTN